MKLSDKQALLSYFKDKRNTQQTVICEITGMTFVISAPILHNVKGYCYSGLSPLANKEAALSLGECTYSEAHYDLAPSTLAGAFLSLSYHYKLRMDHLSAIEANMLISQLPLFQISRALSFLASLSSHQLKRIPRFSLDEGEPEALKNWLSDCQEALDITNYTPTEQPQPKLQSKAFVDSSIITETRKAARELLKLLKADSILPLRLQTIISMSIQKNNLAMISVELRKNIIAALTKLGTENCINLASIFAETGKNLTNQESIVSKLLDEPASQFSDVSNAPSIRMSLAEIIAQKKAQSIQDKIEVVPNTLKLIAELDAEIEAEIEESAQQEDESIDEEFLADHDSEEAIMKESNISELNLEDDDFNSNQDQQDYADDEILDLDTIAENEGV